jgi:hypothetical protein
MGRIMIESSEGDDYSKYTKDIDGMAHKPTQLYPIEHMTVDLGTPTLDKLGYSSFTTVQKVRVIFHEWSKEKINPDLWQQFTEEIINLKAEDDNEKWVELDQVIKSLNQDDPKFMGFLISTFAYLKRGDR